MPSNSSHALKLLKPKEIEEIYGLPVFNDNDRYHIFSLTDQEQNALGNFHTLSSKWLFILQLGYFKARRRFYSLADIARADEDQVHVLTRYFPDGNPNRFTLKITKPTRLAQQTRILELFDYQRYGGITIKPVTNELNRLAKIHARPAYIVRELLRFLERVRIMTPAYSTLQNLVEKCIQDENNRLELLVEDYLPVANKKRLDDLLRRQEKFLHELTLLKRDPKDFSLHEIKQTIVKRDRINELYPHTGNLSQELEISEQNIHYYAELVSYYSIYRLSRMSKPTRRLLLLCFIFIRFQTINDHLVKIMLYRISNYISDGKKAAKEEVYQHKIRNRNRLATAGQLLNLFVDERYLPDDILFSEVRQAAFAIVGKDELAELATSLTDERVAEKALEWKHIDLLARKVQINLRPLLLALEFRGHQSSAAILETTGLIKDCFQKGKTIPSNMPTAWLTKAAKKHIVSKGKVDPFRYEFQVYRNIVNRLESGDIFVSESRSYRSLEEDLIDDESWKNRDALLKTVNMAAFTPDPTHMLDTLELELNQLYHDVNQRIASGENTHIKFSGKNKKRWTLPYTKGSEESSKSTILNRLPPIRLNTLLNLVNSQSNFTEAFTHILGTHVKNECDDSALIAAITAAGTNMGMGKLARNCNISLERINAAYHDRIRPETLKIACDVLTEKIEKLPLFRGWDIDGEKIYSSSDGQKIEVSKDTINARHSSKYFGLGKGIVSYTLNANNVPVNARIIGANDHESHFVLDILHGNTSTIKPDIHTTDSHGTNRVNFALLYLFGYTFAPRYKNFPAEAQKIYCFGQPDQYDGYLLKPKGKADRLLIEDEWDNILRIGVSLALKTATQSTIVRKLSAFPRKNKTRKALGELDKIVKSIHILRYVDDPEFRQHIQKAINRGESFHNLKRAIFYDNSGKFRVSGEYEQLVWSECTRLIALSVIYYNAFILSQIATRLSNLGLDADFLEDVSPIQWQHVDWFGQFYFGEKIDSNEVDKVMTAIENMDFTLYQSKQGTAN